MALLATAVVVKHIRLIDFPVAGGATVFGPAVLLKPPLVIGGQAKHRLSNLLWRGISIREGNRRVTGRPRSFFRLGIIPPTSV